MSVYGDRSVFKEDCTGFIINVENMGAKNKRQGAQEVAAIIQSKADTVGYLPAFKPHLPW